MYLLSVSLWMLRRASSSPVGWFWLVASFLLLPLAEVLTPVAVLGHPADRAALICQVGFLSSLAGSMLAMASLSENDWILGRAGAWRALASRWLGVGLITLVGALLTTLSSSLIYLQMPPIGVYLSLGLSIAHLTALGTLALALPASTSQRVVSLLLLAWVLPAMTNPEGALGRGLAAFLQVYRDPSRFQDVTPSGLLSSATPVLTLGAAMIFFSMRGSPASPR